MYNKRLDQVEYVIKGIAEVSYDINYCLENDTEFKSVKIKVTDPKMFNKLCQEIIEKFDAKALQIIIYKGSKQARYHDTEYIKIIDVPIPAVDNKNNVQIQQVETKKEDLNLNDLIQAKIENATNSLNGIFIEKAKDLELGQLKMEHNHTNELRELKHKYEVESLNNKILVLEKELKISNEEKDLISDELDEQTDKNNELQKLIGDKKEELTKTLMGVGAGLLGGFMKNPTIAALGASIMGGGMPTEETKEEPVEETERTKTHKEIVSWIKSLDDNTFSVFYMLISHMSENPSYLARFYKEKMNLKDDDEEETAK